MSLPPSLSEMKRSEVRPGNHTGQVLRPGKSVTWTDVPPVAETTAMALGARFPLTANCGLPSTKAIQRLSDDQEGEWMPAPCAMAVPADSSIPCTYRVSCRV